MAYFCCFSFWLILDFLQKVVDIGHRYALYLVSSSVGAIYKIDQCLLSHSLSLSLSLSLFLFLSLTPTHPYTHPHILTMPLTNIRIQALYLPTTLTHSKILYFLSLSLS